MVRRGENLLFLSNCSCARAKVSSFREQPRQEWIEIPVPALVSEVRTGKTSLVSALAAHFGLSIYIINLADFNDRSLMGNESVRIDRSLARCWRLLLSRRS